MPGAWCWLRARVRGTTSGNPSCARRIGPLEPALTVEFLAGLPTGAVVKRLSELGEGDIVYTPGYYRDGAGRELHPPKPPGSSFPPPARRSIRRIATFIGTGIVGGIMPSFVEMGREAARNVNRLLAGEAPQALRLPQSCRRWRRSTGGQAQKWGIDASDLPDDAIVHFRQPTYWEANRKQAIAIAIVFLQAGLIAALLVERRLRHRTAHALQESEKRMNLAARAARLSIVDMGSRSRQGLGDHEVSGNRRAGRDADLVRPRPRNRAPGGSGRASTERCGNALAKDEELDVEYRMLQPDGEVRWIAARGRAEKGRRHKRLIGVAMDITERKACRAAGRARIATRSRT